MSDVMRVSPRGCVATSEYWHDRIDDGTLINVSSGALNGSVANGAIYCPLRPYSNLHGVITINGSTDFSFRLLQAPTISDSGTVATPIKLNLHKADSALGCTFYATAALSATGTTLFRKYIASGVGKFGGGAGQGGSEWGFCAGTIYVFQIIPHQVGTFNISCEYCISTD
jgi:hypothetical protein